MITGHERVRGPEPGKDGTALTSTQGVVGLFTASSAGAPIISRAEVRVIPGVGIEGDRYALRTGHWSDPK